MGSIGPHVSGVKMREHKLTMLTPEDFEVFFQCSCGASFWSNGNGLNCVERKGGWISTCPMDLYERHVRKAAFPYFFTEGYNEFEVDIETKRRVLRFLGIAIER
jgi:hypothetical protein